MEKRLSTLLLNISPKWRWTRILELGANADAATDHGQTPLCFAARAGHGQGVELLLKRGANANGVRDDAKPLEEALEAQHFEIARQLMPPETCRPKAKSIRLNSVTPLGRLRVARWKPIAGNIDLRLIGQTDCKPSNFRFDHLYIFVRIRGFEADPIL
jgi:hypothetical protein